MEPRQATRQHPASAWRMQTEAIFQPFPDFTQLFHPFCRGVGTPDRQPAPPIPVVHAPFPTRRSAGRWHGVPAVGAWEARSGFLWRSCRCNVVASYESCKHAASRAHLESITVWSSAFRRSGRVQMGLGKRLAEEIKRTPLPYPLPARPSRGEGIRCRRVWRALVPGEPSRGAASSPSPREGRAGRGLGRGAPLIQAELPMGTFNATIDDTAQKRSKRLGREVNSR